MDYCVQLVKAYALHLEENMDTAIRKLCYGCEVSHPSQIQHDVCVMMEEEERIEHCLKECLKMIDEAEVMLTFTCGLKLSDILKCPDKLCKSDFRINLWDNVDWNEMVIHEILTIRERKRNLRENTL